MIAGKKKYSKMQDSEMEVWGVDEERGFYVNDDGSKVKIVRQIVF